MNTRLNEFELSVKGKASSLWEHSEEEVKEKEPVCALMNFIYFAISFRPNTLFQLPPGLSFVCLKSGP